MGQAQWLKEWILMMSCFWDNILNHPHHSSGLPNDKHALMVYQEEQHKQWHHATSIPGQGYDPLEINEAILELTQDWLLQEHCQKDNEVYKASVSIFASLTHHKKLSSDNFYPLKSCTINYHHQLFSSLLKPKFCLGTRPRWRAIYMSEYIDWSDWFFLEDQVWSEVFLDNPLYLWLGVLAPYIHVILAYVMSITMY